MLKIANFQNDHRQQLLKMYSKYFKDVGYRAGAESDIKSHGILTWYYNIKSMHC